MKKIFIILQIYLKKTGKNEKKVFYFKLYDFKIENGAIIFEDRQEKTTHLIEKINFTLPFISDFPPSFKNYSNPSFTAIVNKTPIKIEGKIKPSSDFQEVEFNLDVNNLHLSKYFHYIPLSFNFDIISGYLNGNFKISFIQPIKGKPSIKIKEVSELKNLEIIDISKNPLFKTYKIATKGSFDLINKTIEISELSIFSPEICIIREKNNNLNILKIFKIKKENSFNSFKFNLKNINISNGKILFTDITLNETFNISLKNITIKGNQISNLKNKIGNFYFIAKTEEKEFIDISGVLNLNPISSKGTFKIENLLLKKYFPYYKNNLFFIIETGIFNSKGIYNLNLKNIKFLKTDFTLNNLSISKGENIIKIPSIIANNIDFDFLNKKIEINNLNSNKGFLKLLLQNDKFDFFPETYDRKVNLSSIKNWKISLKQININNYNFSIKDHFTKNTIAVEKFNFNLSDLSTYKTEKAFFKLFFQLDKKDISAEGYFVSNPIKIYSQTEISEIFMPDFQDFFAKKLNFKIIDGIFSAKGNLIFEKKNRDMFLVNYLGTASIKKLKIIDNLYKQDLLAIDTFYLKDIDINENLFKTDEILIEDFNGNIIVYPDGKINIISILKVNDEVKQKIQKENLNIHVRKINFKNGEINLIDKKTEYGTERFNFNGFITDFYIIGNEIEFYANFDGIELQNILEKIKSL